jgi:hypothetical protein
MEVREAWFQHVAGSAWLTLGPPRIVTPKRDPDGRWRLGDVETSDAELEAARPRGSDAAAKSFALIHQGWRVAPFHLFRPLVYFAAFYAPEVFDCLELAVRSLVRFGRWRYDVLVLTGAETVDTVRTRLAPLGLGERLHVAAVEPAEDIVDWWLSRYRMDAHPIFEAAQPLLYLDVDMVCDRPLEPLLATLAVSDKIHTCRSGLIGEGTPESAGHWFGWRLTAQDAMPFDPNARGFSSGTLGAANRGIARPAYDLILRSAYGYAERTGVRRSFEGYDQCFANYVLFKLGVVEINILAQVLNLFRIPEAGPSHPDPGQARGLVHFHGVPYAERHEVMRAYMAALETLGEKP